MSGREDRIGAFLAAQGLGAARRLPMGADWSNRRYERIRDRARTFVLMDAAADPMTPRFVALAAWLRSCGLHAPEVLAADLAAGLLLLEDLGDEQLAGAIGAGAPEGPLYALATEAICMFQAAAPPGDLPRLDAAGLLGLLDIFLEHVIGGPDAAARAGFAAAWREILPGVVGGPPVFLYRDYHAQNLMWLPRAHGMWRLGLLDFQDAHRGPALYDLVSLVQDARRDVPPAVTAMAVARWRRAHPELGDAELEAGLAVLGAQRAMRILGVAARLTAGGQRRLPPDLVPRVHRHLRVCLDHEATRPLARWCAEHYRAGCAPG